MQIKNISEYIDDNILDVPYLSARVNAAELSRYLKADLESKSIDYNIFNSEKDHKLSFESERKLRESVIKNPPREIYEYQNFFLLKRGSEYILMDGFRRLLWYNAPNIDVNVRIYDASNEKLTNKKLLSLMINLNHFKFFSGSKYHDRGFGLFLRTVFGLNISSYTDALDGYLSSDKIERDYSMSESIDGTTKNKSIQNRIINEHFVDDMKFIEEVTKGGAMMNRFVGALVYSKRAKYDGAFGTKSFLRMCDENASLKPLLAKFKTIGLHRGSESEKLTNQILEIYNNILTVQMGGKMKKSYAEQLTECKAMVESMKKDKGLIKLTGSNFSKELDQMMLEKIEAGEKLQFKCVVYPDKDNELLEPGLHTDVVFINRLIKRHRLSKDIASIVPQFGIKNDKKLFMVRHNTGMGMGYHSYTTKAWATIRQCDKPDHETLRGESYNVDLFLVMPQSVLKAIKNAAK